MLNLCAGQDEAIWNSYGAKNITRGGWMTYTFEPIPSGQAKEDYRLHHTLLSEYYQCGCKHFKNTIKAGGSTVRVQNVDWVMDGWSG